MKMTKRRPSMQIASGFDLEPLPDGNVLIEFFGDDGKSFLKQIVTPSVVMNMPLVATLTGIALREGPDAVREIVGKLSEDQQEEVECDDQ